VHGPPQTALTLERDDDPDRDEAPRRTREDLAASVRAVPDVRDDGARPGRQAVGALPDGAGDPAVRAQLARAPRSVTFAVLGAPGTKGSPYARVHKGRAIVHEGAKSKAWERLVRERALEAVGTREGPTFVDVALDVAITFELARPAGHWAKRGGLKSGAPPWPSRRLDLLDKLCRSTLDALIGSVFDDDSRVVRLLATKIYAAPGHEGARITVQEIAS
jgi:Holliday junction resolvase RusA-like endonuclease